VGKGIATLATDGFAKVISDSETDAILGIHIFGPHSGDLLFAGTALMEFDGTAEDLGHNHGHPSHPVGGVDGGRAKREQKGNSYHKLTSG
jgi:pyruvate/2-oxoglutarate dehydrogenase complex dihydrolipoamide dehydrogenase (E3) component